MSLDKRIKDHRIKCGMSQEKVAELVGVSRQAVTKWETGDSAPSTENLFRLAEVFGTTVDMLLSSDQGITESDRTENEEKLSVAEEIFRLYKKEEERQKEEKRLKKRENIICTLTVAFGHALLYLLCRVFCTVTDEMAIMSWLFGTSSGQLTYLFGWLLHQNIYPVSVLISVTPAVFGKKYFSFVTLIGFALGILFGELFGPNPAGAEFGMGHYGWLIWGCIFASSVIIGMILERKFKSKKAVYDKKRL